MNEQINWGREGEYDKQEGVLLLEQWLGDESGGHGGGIGEVPASALLPDEVEVLYNRFSWALLLTANIIN